MRFDQNTAGGMMNTEIVVVGEDATRGEVVDYIRFHEVGLDQLDNIVLINRDAALAGTVPVARLILAGSDQRMAELAFEPLLSVRPDAKDKEVFELFDKYNLRSLAVVDDANCPDWRDHRGRRGEPHARKDLAENETPGISRGPRFRKRKAMNTWVTLTDTFFAPGRPEQESRPSLAWVREGAWRSSWRWLARGLSPPTWTMTRVGSRFTPPPALILVTRCSGR